MIIEIARPEEAKEISLMIERSVRASFPKFYPDCSIEYVVSSLDENGVLERMKWTNFYVAKIENKIVGCGAIGEYWGSKTESSLFNIFVDPDYQRQGIGRKIVETLEQDELFLRAKRIEVPAGMVGIPFYKKLGYRHKNNELIYEDGHFAMEKFNDNKN